MDLLPEQRDVGLDLLDVKPLLGPLATAEAALRIADAYGCRCGWDGVALADGAGHGQARTLWVAGGAARRRAISGAEEAAVAHALRTIAAARCRRCGGRRRRAYALAVVRSRAARLALTSLSLFAALMLGLGGPQIFAQPWVWGGVVALGAVIVLGARSALADIDAAVWFVTEGELPSDSPHTCVRLTARAMDRVAPIDRDAR